MISEQYNAFCTWNNIVYFFLLGTTFLIIIRLLRKDKIPKGLKGIPSTRGWPLIGVLFSFEKPLFNYVFGLKQKHGDIFMFRLGCRDFIVLNTSNIMHRTLKEMGNIFSGRWQDSTVSLIMHDSGIIFQDKERWEIHRGFVLKVLRDFGLGKQRSQDIVNYECSLLMEEIGGRCGVVTNTKSIFPRYMINVISKLLFNMRFESSDPKFTMVTKVLENLIQNQSFAELIIIVYPSLEKLPNLCKFMYWCCGLNKTFGMIFDYIKDLIEEHKKRFNHENEGEDLIDMFLKEEYKLALNNVKDHTFTDWQLIVETTEIFAAGYETTSSTLSWGMLFLAQHQHVQEKMYQEIMDIIGPSRSPTPSDKKLLIYTQAVMDEILRLSSVVPLSIPHRVLEDTSIDGYFIPKNSVILPNIYGAHHDKNTWAKPFEFFPEHFLSQIGGTQKYLPRDDLMPFGIGKRQCLGESLARLEYFIFLTNIIQKFKISFPQEFSDEEFQMIMLGSDGLIHAPLKDEVIFDFRR